MPLLAKTRKSRARKSAYHSRRRHRLLKKTVASRRRLSYLKGHRGRKSGKRSKRRGNKKSR